MRFLVVGAGVGQVYAGRLHGAGHDVTLLARGSQIDVLQERGVQLETNGSLIAHNIAVRPELPEGEEFDCALLAVRYGQVESALKNAEQACARTDRALHPGLTTTNDPC